MILFTNYFFRKTLGFLIFLLLLSFFYLNTPSVFASENVLKNDGFEAQNLQWNIKIQPSSALDRLFNTLHITSSSIETAIETNPSLTYNGQKSLEITATKDLGINQTATINPEKHFFANVNVLVKTGSVKLIITDTNGKELSQSSHLNQTDWQRLTIDIPPHAMSSQVTLSIVATNNAQWYVDNTILHEIEDTALPKQTRFQDFHDPQFFWKGKKVEQPKQNPIQALGGGIILPLPSVSHTYTTRVVMAVQTDPLFATPQNIITHINSRLTNNNINKQLAGTVELFDQSIPTNCTVSTYSTPIYAPDEFCTGTLTDSSILIAIVHGGYDGYASYPGKLFSSDISDISASQIDKYFVVLHELGHVLGFDAHYDDVWTADAVSFDKTYTSPFINDMMGLGNRVNPSLFLDHSKQVVNRSPNLSGIGVDILRSNLPDTISLTDSANHPFYGQITLYPAVYAGQHTNSHVVSTTFSGPYGVYGTLDYRFLDKPLLSLVKAENSHGNAYVWLDSSVIQLAFWQGSQPTLAIPLLSDPASISATPIPTFVPVVGDINGDHMVNIQDFEIWRCEFVGNGVCASPHSDHASDLDHNTIVDLADFIIWRNAFTP